MVSAARFECDHPDPCGAKAAQGPVARTMAGITKVLLGLAVWTGSAALRHDRGHLTDPGVAASGRPPATTRSSHPALETR
jgi:hypothetical protein